MLRTPGRIIAFTAVGYVLYMWIFIAKTDPGPGWTVFTAIFGLVCFSIGAYRGIRRLPERSGV